MSIVLYDYWRSSASYRVRIALNLKRVAYESRPVSLIDGAQNADENRARNPQGFVPTLEVDGAPLTQSLAIIEWLDQTYPDPPLLPAHPDRPRRRLGARAGRRVRHPPGRQSARAQAAGDAVRCRQGSKGRLVSATGWNEGLEALETLAGEGPFLGGLAPDLSDVCLIPQLYNARRFDVPLDRLPEAATRRCRGRRARCLRRRASRPRHPLSNSTVSPRSC